MRLIARLRAAAGVGLLLLSASSYAEAGDDLWATFCAEAAMDAPDPSAVERSARWHTRSATHFQELLYRAEPWLWHTMSAVRARGLPIELAVLPAIESGFQADARSHRAAGGLWQLMPATARRFGVPIQADYDGRADVGHSTRAALDYLVYLRGRFATWPLTLAAYNAGEGTVVRALRAIGARPGMHVAIHRLRLPGETRAHLHRFLGFVRAVCDPRGYGYVRPVLPARPLIAAVHFNRQVALTRVAELATTSVADLQRVNAALSRDRTPAGGPHRVWVPAHRQSHLAERLRDQERLALVEHGQYRVQPGDTLSHIAIRHGTTAQQLMAMNKLSSTRIRVGKTLIVPLPTEAIARAPDA
ncbi:MAG: transglycosylase SLT domain-containing protein [Algiphilus sp.]